MGGIKLSYIVIIIAIFSNCSGKNSKSGYVIDETGITRENLENYLHRSVTMAEFLTVDPFCNDANYPDKERDVKLKILEQNLLVALSIAGAMRAILINRIFSTMRKLLK